MADVKPANRNEGAPRKGRILPGGRIELPGVTLHNLIMYAYGVQENMIQGGPAWARTEPFDVVAKAPPDAAPETLRLMFQALLAERFKLVNHREDKAMPAYVLTVGKWASKLRPGTPAQYQCNWSNLESGLRRRDCHNMTMAELANQLPGWGGIGIDLPVVDQTGLKGGFDFQLDIGMPGSGKKEGARGPDGPAPDNADSGPTIFTALEQIGLKLESRKVSLPIFVIDRAEQP